MHILFFNRSFYPDSASTGQLLTELCEDLVQKHNAQVSVIAGPVRGTPTSADQHLLLSKLETYHGIRILRTRSTTFRKELLVGRICNYLSYFACAFHTGWFRNRPQVIVSYTDPPVIGLAAWFRSRILGAKFVMVCQDIFPQVAALIGGFEDGFTTNVLEWISRFLIRSADAVVAIGETMQKRLIDIKKADPEKIHVIHNWADCSAITPSPRVNEFSNRQGLDGCFVVMHSGNVGLSQSLETLLEAAAHLREKMDIEFVIVGDGAKKNALQEAATKLGLNHVEFLPYQPKEKLSESFGTADVFIILLKSGMSGFIVPSKLYGILAAGRPYVAAVEDDSEVAQITREYECGLLCQPGNAEDLAKKILQLYNDRELGLLLGARARNAATNYDRPKQVERYFQLFNKLIDRGDS